MKKFIEENWEECLNFNSAVKITPNKQKAISLIRTSKNRLKFIYSELNEESASYIFEDYYTSVLELLQALVLIEGYNVNNHLCLGYYLRDVLKRDDIFRIFDDLRFKRNSIVYYGELIDFDIAKDSIEKSKFLMDQLNILIDKKS